MKHWRLISAFALCGTLAGCIPSTPDVVELRHQNVCRDRPYVFQYQLKEGVKTLSLPQMILIALNCNLEVRIQAMREAAQRTFAYSEFLRLLPAVTLDGTIAHRSHAPTTLFTAPTSEKNTRIRSLSVAWNLVDYGLFFYRAHQEEKRAVVLEQENLRERQELILEMVESYWQALAYQDALDEAEKLMAALRERERVIAITAADDVISEVNRYRLEAALVDLETEIGVFQRNYSDAKLRLIALMGLHPCSEFQLAHLEPFTPCPPEKMDLCHLTQEALKNRPELAQGDFEELITLDEIRSDAFRLFPNADIRGDYNEDKNKFLVFNHWVSIAADIAWNLFSLPSGIERIKSGNKRRDIVRHQRYAAAAGVVAQLYLSHMEYEEASKAYEMNDRLYRSRLGFADSVEKEYLAGVRHATEALQARVEALGARVQALVAYGEMQTSLERIANSVGKPLLFTPEAWKNQVYRQLLCEQRLESFPLVERIPGRPI